MPFELPSLPYDYDALEPYVSRKTLKVHHDVLQRRYVKKLNGLVRGTSWDQLPLEQLIVNAPNEDVFDNAAQVWNHTFFWYSMTSDGNDVAQRSGFGRAVEMMYGSVDHFRKAFRDAARDAFGSTWFWVSADLGGNVVLSVGENADNPMRHGYRPLLTCDLWEHAFFLDYPGKRSEYVDVFLDHLVNWQFAEANYERAFGT